MLIDDLRTDITSELVEFINDKQFANFEIIMNQMYLSKLSAFHKSADVSKLAEEKAILNTYLGLSKLIRLEAENRIERKRIEQEKA